jgi:DNA-directed RNA polymerase specialized sigma24 family protein
MAIAKHKTRQRELREGRALARRVQRGDGKAFELLYASYEGGLYRFCHRLTGSDAAAAALVEATFVRALGTLPEGRLDALDVAAHLHATARALAYERHINGGPLWLDPAGGGEHASEVNAANQRLAPRQRMTLALRELERRSDAEIAVALGAEARAVPALVARARLRLRAELGLPPAVAGCRERLAAVSAYADDTLPEDRRAELEEHLVDCAACRAALFALEEAALRYGALPVPAPPGELTSRIAVALGAAGMPARRPRTGIADPVPASGGRQTVAAAAMAALVIIGAGVTIVAARDDGDEADAPRTPARAASRGELAADAALRPAIATRTSTTVVPPPAPPVVPPPRGGAARTVQVRPVRPRVLPPPDAGAPVESSLRPFSSPSAPAPAPPPQQTTTPKLPPPTIPKPSRPIPVEIVPPIAPPPTPAAADPPPPPPGPPATTST